MSVGVARTEWVWHGNGGCGMVSVVVICLQ